jgi:rSAM/selenodomain-associated transferase 2
VRLSIIIPVLNEAEIIQPALLALQPLRQRGHEIIVVDGGSRDNSRLLAAELADAVLTAGPGRAAQMNCGAAVARGDILLFLHIDTRLPADADRQIARVAAEQAHAWGRFDIRLSSQRFIFGVIARLINLRSRLTGIATGDQAIFIAPELFRQVGGYPEIELMEDIAISRRLRKRQSPHCLTSTVITSSRRWEQYGVWRTILRMWWLRLAYFCGADPNVLARHYRNQNG